MISEFGGVLVSHYILSDCDVWWWDLELLGWIVLNSKRVFPASLPKPIMEWTASDLPLHSTAHFILLLNVDDAVVIVAGLILHQDQVCERFLSTKSSGWMLIQIFSFSLLFSFKVTAPNQHFEAIYWIKLCKNTFFFFFWN